MGNPNPLLLFETISGSRLYGTDTPESDYDYRGVAIPQNLEYAFGIQNFDQQQSKEEDRVIYNLRKFVKLALDSNPNILELLWAPETHWLTTSTIWNQIISFRDLFMSKKIRVTFIGYALSELKKMYRHREWLLDPPTQPTKPEWPWKELGLSQHPQIGKEAVNKMKAHPELLKPGVLPILHQEAEFYSANEVWTRFKNWRKDRNPKRFALEEASGYDTKNAMHLIRLLKSGLGALKSGILSVDRRDLDAAELREIRAGKYSYEEIVSYAKELQMEIEAVESPLPERPQVKKVYAKMVEIYKDFYLSPR